MIRELRQHGFAVERDDFGTGYSSLNMLAELPLDVVKLDLRFLRGDRLDDESARRRALVIKFVIELVQALDLTVVAEGVETVEQARLLAECNCELAQGYLYAKPMPQAEFDSFWQADDAAKGEEGNES